MNLSPHSAVCCIGVLLLGAASPESQKTYTNNFEQAEVGKVPDDIMVLDGPFAVREVDRHKCLELAGDPIGSFGALFGPEGIAASDVKARIWAASAGKRFPEFGIGANDVGGYKLILAPGRRALELRKGDQTATSVPAKWSTRTWTRLRLRVRSKDKKTWTIEGKIWPDGQPEPREWTIRIEDREAPSPGKASIWADDFSEQPVRFDDLGVMPIAGERK